MTRDGYPLRSQRMITTTIGCMRTTVVHCLCTRAGTVRHRAIGSEATTQPSRASRRTVEDILRTWVTVNTRIVHEFLAPVFIGKADINTKLELMAAFLSAKARPSAVAAHRAFGAFVGRRALANGSRRISLPYLFQGSRIQRHPFSTSPLCASANDQPAEMPPSKDYSADPAEAEKMLEFINKSWTAYHAVEETAKRLQAAGYTHLKERDEWAIRPGGRYYFTRSQSTIVAFAVGAKYEPGNGFYIVGAHTDSPCLKLKPISKYEKSKHTMVNVETYGGGLWTTWFDRDLTVAGRVLVRTADGNLSHRLVKLERPLLRIPMLAIHLNRNIYSDGFKPNSQQHLTPVLATAVKDACNSAPSSDNPGSHERHGTTLLKLLSEELGCKPDEIVDLELNVVDTQDGVIGGAHNEFVWVGRLDNLAMSYCSLTALLETTSPEQLEDEVGIRAVALFDHEEVGSDSAQGAGGPVMLDTIKRVATLLGKGQEGVVVRSIQRSMLVSADMAHSLHPNYAEKHDPHHQPKFHAGVVIKHHCNQRYATNSVTASLFRELAFRKGIPVQEFAIRTDLACGSTIGPILSSSMGIRTVDVGAPQLSMHSIREMMGVDDVSHTVNHFKAFFEDFSKLDATIDVDGLAPADIQGTIDDVPCGHMK